MNQLQNKKISVFLILFSFLGLLTSFLIKEPYDYGLQIYYEKNNASMPFTEYFVNFLFIEFNLRRLVVFFVIVFGLGLYTFLYKNDEEIKKFTKSKTVLKKPFFQKMFNSIKTFFSKLFQGFFSFYSSSNSNILVSETDIVAIETKPLYKKLSQRTVLFFMLMYIWPIFLTIILARDYLDKPFSEIDALQLEIDVMKKGQIRTQILLNENFDFTNVFKNSLYNANPFSEIREYKNLNYISQLLNLCGTSSLTQSDKELLKQYSRYFGILQISKTDDNTKTYRNLAYFTVIFAIIILYVILSRYKKNRYFKWLIYLLFLYCFVHIIFINLTNKTEKVLDETLTEKFKEGCLS